MIPTVLVVADDRDIARTYHGYLADAYAVRVAHDTDDALSALDGSVDVVLLDRRLPDRPGRDVLDRIRERELDIRVATVTAVDPGLEAVGMGFDEYVIKPTTRGELRATVERLLALRRHADDVRAYHSLLVKLAGLRERAAARGRDGYADLEARVTALEATIESEATRLTDDAAFVATLRAIDTPRSTEARPDG